MAYDTKCHDLAEYFLAADCMPAGNPVRHKNDLAQTIQDAIEAWLARDGEPTVPLSEYGRNMVFGPWVEWSGGECPLPDYEKPEIRYRSGGETELQAGSARWSHVGAWDDVMAYRVRLPVAPGLAP